MTPYEQRVRVAAVVRNDRAEILCVRHFNRGEPFWTLPGGEPQATETPETAILREVAEETGWNVHLGGIIFVCALHADRWERPKIELVFSAVPLSHDSRVSRAADVVESHFFAFSEVPPSFRPREALALLRVTTTVPYVNLAVEGLPDGP